MMNLFSSFNPITSPQLALNWMIIILPSLMMMSSVWPLKSKALSLSKLLIINIAQSKSSLTKVNTPNLIMISVIMIMIMIYNFTSLMPNLFSITAHIAINLSMALTLWLALMKKKMNSMRKLMSNLTPTNTPALLIPFMVLIELVSLMIQPITLSIRLTANITAGHIMMVLISQMYHLFPIPTLLMNLIMMMLEMGVSLIQAYVFSMLIVMYSK